MSARLGVEPDLRSGAGCGKSSGYPVDAPPLDDEDMDVADRQRSMRSGTAT